MPETVTESFCERCGTRYAFEATPERKKRSIGSALGLSRSRNGTGAVKPALDPFLTIFRFCLGCRQYVCPGCWNEESGFCATCEPFPGALPIELAAPGEAIEEPEEPRGPVSAEAWPRSDLGLADLVEEASVDEPVEPLGAVEAVEAVEALEIADGDDSDVMELREHQPVEEGRSAALQEASASEPALEANGPTDQAVDIVSVVEEAPAVPAAIEAAADDAPPAAAHADPELEVAWNHLLLDAQPTIEDLVDEPADWQVAVVSFETMVAEAEPEVLEAAPDPEPEPVAASEPEPVAVSEPEPEPEPEPTMEPLPDVRPWQFIAPDQPRRDSVQQPVWSAGPRPTDPSNRPRGLDAPPRPALPSGSFYVPQASAGMTAAPPPAPPRSQAPRGSMVQGASGIRPCSSCALPLSGSARFCRRCGNPQS